MVESNVARKVDRHESQQFTADILYGFINALMVFPVSISFCSIIFRNEFFRGHIPLLVKLVLFSSAIHQFTFSTFSSLPFAVGQVQDAGLIFLSAIASSIVESHKDQSIEKDVTLSTTLVILALSTFFLGICLILLGKLRLASYLQYLPMPVVGGYLAFIGFFCGSAGIGMMAGIEITSIADWYYIANEKSILHVVPGVAAGCLYYMLLYSIKSPWTLPCLMLGTLVIFYAVLFFRGLTFEQARDNDWMMPQSPHAPFYTVWKVYDVSIVDWSQLPRQFFRWMGMVLVVAFSSSLDVAAIEMELGKPLDYDRELTTVGLSNLFSGALGGYTGSYIFSQTIFNLRRGVTHRACGYIIGTFELVLLIVPFSIAAYMPKLLFGGLLILIAIDLLNDWLVSSYSKMSMVEYIICWMTFLAIQLVGIELGLLVGILFAILGFTISYVALLGRQFKDSLYAKHGQPSEIRGDNIEEDLTMLMQLSPLDRIVVIPLTGYIFFGTAVGVLHEIRIKLAATGFSAIGGGDYEHMSTKNTSRRLLYEERNSNSRSGSVSEWPSGIAQEHGSWVYPFCCCKSEKEEEEEARDKECNNEHIELLNLSIEKSYGTSDNDVHALMANVEAVIYSPTHKLFYDSPVAGKPTRIDDMQTSSNVLVLDFRLVLGVDSTATRSCFLMLVESMHLSKCRVVFINISPETESLFRIHKVITERDVVIRRYPLNLSATLSSSRSHEF